MIETKSWKQDVGNKMIETRSETQKVELCQKDRFLR